MLIFWYANSIWELEGGSFSSRENRDHSGGKLALFFKALFVLLFLKEGSFVCKESSRALWIQRKLLAGFCGL